MACTQYNNPWQVRSLINTVISCKLISCYTASIMRGVFAMLSGMYSGSSWSNTLLTAVKHVLLMLILIKNRLIFTAIGMVKLMLTSFYKTDECMMHCTSHSDIVLHRSLERWSDLSTPTLEEEHISHWRWNATWILWWSLCNSALMIYITINRPVCNSTSPRLHSVMQMVHDAFVGYSSS